MDDDVKFARGRVLCVCVFGVFFGVVAFISEWIIIFFYSVSGRIIWASVYLSKESR